MRFLADLLLIAASAFPQAPAPFTLTEVSRQFDSAGNLVSEWRFLYAVSRDGSIVSTDLDPSAGGARQILDAVNGRDILVTPQSQSAAVMPRPGTGRLNSRPPCENRFFAYHDAVVTVDNAAGKLLDVPVERISVTWPEGGEIEVWVAPSLGCQMLRTVSRRNGQSLETRVAEHLRLGDPDPALFETPPYYRETTVTIAPAPSRTTAPRRPPSPARCPPIAAP